MTQIDISICVKNIKKGVRLSNLISPCPNCSERTTFSQQRKDDSNKKLSTHSAEFFDVYGQPVERRRVSQKYSKYDYANYAYCTNCTKRRKNLYYSDINKQVKQFNFPKRAFLLEHFEMYDVYHRYQYQNDRMEIAKSLGYQYISEATAKLYKETGSIYHAGRILKITPHSVRVELNMMGIKRNRAGGQWCKGISGRWKNIDTKEQYLKLTNRGNRYNG